MRSGAQLPAVIEKSSVGRSMETRGARRAREGGVIRDLSAPLLGEIVAINVRAGGSAPSPRFEFGVYEREFGSPLQRQNILLASAAGKPADSRAARRQAARRKLAIVQAARSVCRHWRDSVDYSSIDWLDLNFSQRRTCPDVPGHLFTGCT